LWHYRFVIKGRLYSGTTRLPAKKEHRDAAEAVERQAHADAIQEYNQKLAIRTVSGPAPIATARKTGEDARFRSGSVAELIVCAEFVAKGYDVYRAVDPRAATDLIYWDGSKAVRVEVKFLRTGTEKRLGRDLLRNFGKFDILATVNELGSIALYTEQEARAKFLAGNWKPRNRKRKEAA
jgi:hypothetical protein